MGRMEIPRFDDHEDPEDFIDDEAKVDEIDEIVDDDGDYDGDDDHEEDAW